MEATDNQKQDTAQIIVIVSSRSALNKYDSDTSAKVACKKKASTGVLSDRNQKGKKTSKHKGYQHYYMLWKKAGITDRKYKSHISNNCFGHSSDQEPIKEGLGGIPVSSNGAVK